MRNLVATSVGIFVFTTALIAQDVPRAEVFGGYSYLNADFNKKDTGIPRQSFNGWEASVAVNANRWLAVEGDVSGYYKTIDVGSLLSFPRVGVNISSSDYAFAGGPRVNLRPGFVHALFGVNHITGSVLGASGSQNAFAAALGGGFQYNVSRRWGVRGSADYILTRHNFFGPNRVTQNHIRVSGGIVFMFGQAGRRKEGVPSQPTMTTTTGQTASQVTQLGLSVVQDSHGIRVVAVDPRGPVAQAPPIAQGDYINGVDGVQVQTVGELNAALAANTSGIAKVQYRVKGWYQAEREVELKK